MVIEAHGVSFRHTVQAKEGKHGCRALSRLPTKVTLATISFPFVLDFEELEEQVADDPYLANIVTAITTNPAAYPHFTKSGSTLRHKGRVVILATSPLVPHLL